MFIVHVLTIYLNAAKNIYLNQTIVTCLNGTITFAALINFDQCWACSRAITNRTWQIFLTHASLLSPVAMASGFRYHAKSNIESLH